MNDDIHYDSRFKTAVCRPCGTAVVVRNKKAKIAHFRGEPHFLKGAALHHRTVQLASLDLCDIDDVEYPPYEEVITPVYGLPIHQAYVCEQCPHELTINVKNARAHVSSQHHIVSGRSNRGLRSCRVQTLFRARQCIRYFEVQEDLASTTAPSDVEHPDQRQAFDDSYRRLMRDIDHAEEDANNQVQRFDAHQSSVIPWVQICGFDRHYPASLDQKTIRASFRQPEKGDTSENAVLVRQITTRAKAMLEETWSWCVDGPDCRLTRPMAVILSQFWTEATIHSRGFRAGINRSTRNEYFDWWAGCICYFWRVSSGLALSHTSASTIPTANHVDIEERPLCRGTKLQHSIFTECLDAAAVADSVGEDERLGSCIQRFSLALIQQKLPRSRFDSPVLSYCAALAVNFSTRGWKEPGNFNKCLSGLIYCAQLWILREACRQIDLDESVDGDDVLHGFCQQWLRQERSTTYGIILNWRLMLFSVARKMVTSKSVTWSLDGAEVSFQGTTIRMDQITQLYRRTLDRAQRILDEDLLLGADHLPRMNASALHESEHRQEVGWWFAIDSRNTTLLRYRDNCLVGHIRSTSRLRAFFLDSDGQWRPSAMRLYEHHSQQLLECLVVLLQLYPAKRGSEVWSITWRNTAKLRSVLLKWARVMIYTTYHKGQAQLGSYKDNIHFLPPRLSNLLLDFLVYVQSLRRIFLWQQHGRLMSPFLWTKDGQLWAEGSLTRIMRRMCALAEVPALSVSHWRQICASVVKVKFGSEQRVFSALLGDEAGEDGEVDDDGEDEDVAVLARLSNHTVRTHNRAYANETALVAANVWDGLIKRSFRACMLWSEFFEFEPRDSSDTVSKKRSRPLSGTGGEMVKRLMLATPTKRKHWSGPALLEQARDLFRDPSFRWRCAEQERALCIIMSQATEVLVVLGTGVGKSLLFQLPCMISGSRTTVLVVPLVALTLDLARRCRDMRIDCELWSHNHATRASLVFMSAEAAVSEAGQAYLFALHHAEQLDRIVLDECHLICKASVYRKSMFQLASLRGIAVQFVYLTATLPTHLRDELYRRHYLSQAVEIRASTRRVNIGYAVHRFPRSVCDLSQATAEYLRKWWKQQASVLSHADRAICFVRTKADADRLASLLKCSSYHADQGNAEQKANILTQWMAPSSESPFLVGTSGLGAGLDYAQVRLVLHVDEPYGLVDFVQESGRAGRDQQPAHSVVVLQHGWKPPVTSDIDEDERRLHQYLTTGQCRRLLLDSYIDGIDDQQVCSVTDNRCDNCTRRTVPSADPLQSRPPMPSTFTQARGPILMLEHTKQETNAMETYRARLEAVRDQCLTCRLDGLEHWAEHDFDACRNPRKWEFINAKREVLSTSRQSWIAKYSACFRCYQPQSICGRDFSERCVYGDLVMQGTLMAFQQDGLQQQLEKRFDVSFASAVHCLKWAGGKTEFGGVNCVRGVVVLAFILEQLERLSSS